MGFLVLQGQVKKVVSSFLPSGDWLDLGGLFGGLDDDWTLFGLEILSSKSVLS